MYAFNYHRPASVADAAALVAAHGDAKIVSGGMTLIPTLKQRLAAPSDLIDLGGIGDLVGITLDGRSLTIGAMTLHADVATSADVKGAIPALAELAGNIGDAQVRNRGTIGGSLANSDPAADYPAAVLGLGATIITSRREIAGDVYFQGLFETALTPGEIIVAVRFPIPEKAAYEKFPNPASRYAVVGVFVAKTGTGIRVGVTGAGPCAFRIKEMEAALTGNLKPEAIAGIKIPADGLNSDMHASAEYRAHLVSVLAGRAVAALG